MINVNTAVISGRVANTPYFREEGEEGQKPMILFSVAVNQTYKRDGEVSERVSFIDCAVFGKHAAWLHENMPKGTFVIVQGELSQRLIPQDDGTNTSKTSISAQKVIVPPRAKDDSAREMVREPHLSLEELRYDAEVRAAQQNAAMAAAESEVFALYDRDIEF